MERRLARKPDGCRGVPDTLARDPNKPDTLSPWERIDTHCSHFREAAWVSGSQVAAIPSLTGNNWLTNFGTAVAVCWSDA
jgi:hypothetical protein